MIFDRDWLCCLNERRKDEQCIDVEICVEPLLVANRIVSIIVSADIIKRCALFSFFKRGNVCNNLLLCRDSHGDNNEVPPSWWSLVFE